MRRMMIRKGVVVKVDGRCREVSGVRERGVVEIKREWREEMGGRVEGGRMRKGVGMSMIMKKVRGRIREGFVGGGRKGRRG